MKIIKLFFKLIVIVILFFTLLIIVAKVYEKQIIGKAVSVLNKKIDFPVFVSDISFSIIKKFPDATLELSDVTILSSEKLNKNDFTKNADTLLYVKKLFLSVNILSLRNNKLEIIKAYADNARINIFVDKQGHENYNIFPVKEQIKQQNSDTLSDNTLKFMLNKIQFKQLSFKFINRYKNISGNLYAPLYTIKGEFYKNEYSAVTSGKLRLTSFKQGKIVIKPDDFAKINLIANVTNNKIEFVNSKIYTKNITLLVNGNISTDKVTFVDVNITGNSNNINDIASFILTDNSFITSGELGISAIIKGKISSKISPYFTVNYRLINGSIKYTKQNISISNIELNGNYTNGKSRNLSTSKLTVSEVKAQTDKSNISNGKFSIINFNNPYIKLSADANIDISNITALFSIKSDYQISGNITGNIAFSGKYSAEKKFMHQLKIWNKNIDAQCDINIKTKDITLLKADLKSDIKLIDNSIYFSDISGNINKTDLTTSSIVINDYFTPIVDSTAYFNINTDIKADKFYYKNFKNLFNKKTGTNSKPLNINLKSKIKLNYAEYEKIKAKNISTLLLYRSNNLTISNLKADIFNGSITSDIKYFKNYDNRYILQTHTKTSKVNVKSLFTSFDDFKQKMLKAENISGNVTSDFDFEAYFKNNKIETATIEMLGHIKIENGKLTNYKPIQEVAKYSEISDLKDIEFSIIENNIMISEQTVHIPQMNINSNAFDISLYGWQKFNSDFEYHLHIYLSDFIGGKSKRLAKQQSEFGYIEDDSYGKKSLFIKVSSENGNIKTGLDKEVIKQNFKKNIQQEKFEFKKALHDEFGWFKKDSTLNKPKPKQKKKEFIIEWDDE